MKRREFVKVLCGVALVWPRPAAAQKIDEVRRIGVLSLGSRSTFNDEAFEALSKSLSALGWMDGYNVRIDYRWARNDPAQLELLADELLSLRPDLIIAPTTRVVTTFQRKTKTIPIVFVAVGDPIASGIVESLSHPGANITGFSNFEPTLVGKYIEILKEIVPKMDAVRWMYNADGIGHSVMSPLLEAAAQYHGIKFAEDPVRDSSEIEAVMSSLGDNRSAGLVVAGEPFMVSNLDLILALAKRYRVPTVYSFRLFVVAGGLISYGNDLVDQYRQAATYIDRLFKGANPSQLPVQAPIKFEMVINLKAAREIGLSIPPTLLAHADEVIE